MSRHYAALAAIGALAALFAGCASAPVNYYTLVPAHSSAVNPAKSAFAFELATVSVPAQVDQPQLVVRQNGAGMALVESERWIAPLADEVRGAIAAELVGTHAGNDLSGLPQNGRERIRITIDLRRFDSQPGRQASLEAAWTLRKVPGDAAPLACSSRITETVGSGYDALVLGHQRALARLAGQLAGPATAMASGGMTRCP